MSNGHYNVGVEKVGPSYIVTIEPAHYRRVEMLSTEADELAREINAAAQKARRLNNPPRAFYK